MNINLGIVLQHAIQLKDGIAVGDGALGEWGAAANLLVRPAGLVAEIDGDGPAAEQRAADVQPALVPVRARPQAQASPDAADVARLAKPWLDWKAVASSGRRSASRASRRGGEEP